MVQHELPRQAVELGGGDAGDHMRDQHVQALRGQPPGHAHALERLGAVHLDLVGAELGVDDVVGEGHMRVSGLVSQAVVAGASIQGTRPAMRMA